MKENAFLDKSNIPNINQLKNALSNCYDYYLKLMELAKEYDTKWTFYKGWSLKVFKKGKALFYLVPFNGYFTINMAIREAERNSMISDPSLAPFKQALYDAEKFLEGYSIIIDVHDLDSFNLCFDFVSKLMCFR